MSGETEILENLRDAGCEEADISAILDCLKRGDGKKTEQLMERCRKKELLRLHDSQRRLDRLDYLRYRLQKERQERH